MRSRSSARSALVFPFQNLRKMLTGVNLAIFREHVNMNFSLASDSIQMLSSGMMAKKKNPGAMAMVAARMKKISPARRREIARNAAEARWAKAREEKGAA